MSSTVFALATAPGRAAVAVVRLTGAGVSAAVETLTGRPVPPPRRASLRSLYDGDGARLDDALVTWMPGPDSYTGEDVAELGLHGGPAVVEAVLAALAAQGLRPAEPGEFTRRAFQNGRLDLAQAEAVADLIDAESEAQRRQALGQLQGALSARYADWAQRLTDALAWLEASVDFPDEDLPEAVDARARPPLEAVAEAMRQALSEAARGVQVREGLRIALVGPPNAGKSSLFNALVGRDAAIVTPIPGTTRDVIEARLRLAGHDVLLADTAGDRATDDAIEAEGVRRAQAWAETASLRLHLRAGGDRAGPAGPADWWVRTHVDLDPAPDWPGPVLDLKGGQGVEALRQALAAFVVQATTGADFPAVTRERHRQRLAEAVAHLDRALDRLTEGSAELAAEDVRLSLRAIEAVTGRVDVEQVLDRIFASFCIGK